MAEQIVCKNQQPIPANYSGVTINISNPTLNAGSSSCPQPYVDFVTDNQNVYTRQNENQAPIQSIGNNNTLPVNEPTSDNRNNIQSQGGLPQAYPPQYYLNNYNYMTNPQNPVQNGVTPNNNNVQNLPINQNPSTQEDLSKSQNIINNLNTKSEEEKEAKKNSEEKKVVTLTNEYIMSLENYLNNENKEIRLMASKEILTRLDEDKDRYDDAALNALLNKMLQDPEKLIRIAALSAFSSGLACGNDYTVKLLNDIQQNPNADKEDAMEAANILLNMAAGKETRYVQKPQAPENTDTQNKEVA